VASSVASISLTRVSGFAAADRRSDHGGNKRDSKFQVELDRGKVSIPAFAKVVTTQVVTGRRSQVNL